MKTPPPSIFPPGMVTSVTMFLVTMFLTLLTGCTQSRTYRIMVRNATDSPITIGFTKDGPPHEMKWASPEELTDIPPSRRPPTWGQVVDPSHKAAALVQGTFSGSTHAFLRVYLGVAPLDDLLAMSHGNGYRADIALQPNIVNDFTITTPNGRITARLTPLPPHP